MQHVRQMVILTEQALRSRPKFREVVTHKALLVIEGSWRASNKALSNGKRAKAETREGEWAAEPADLSVCYTLDEGALGAVGAVGAVDADGGEGEPQDQYTEMSREELLDALRSQ